MIRVQLDSAQRELNIDNCHISLTGLYQGGHRNLDHRARSPPHPLLRPRPLAAATSTHTAPAPRRAPTDLAVYQGKLHLGLPRKKDDVVPPAESGQILALKKAHQTPTPKLTPLPRRQPRCWDNAYAKKRLGQWLTKQRRASARYGT